MNLGLWVLQILLGAAFVVGGGLKATRPLDALKKQFEWAHWVSPGTVRLVGVRLGTDSHRVPHTGVTNFEAGVTPIAAAALVVVMALAAALHVKHDDAAHVAPSVLIGVLAALIAIGRF